MTNVASRHRLLPPERWFASFVLERQRTHRTQDITRLEVNYGPEGIALSAVAILWGCTASLLGCVGIVLLFTSGGQGPSLHPGYYILFISIMLGCLGVIRASQAVYAGRRFRGGRSLVKGP